MIKIAFASLGCSKNLVDTENMITRLIEAGYEITSDEGSAQVIVVNTCCFIEDAKKEAIDTILELAQYKTQGNCRAIIVTGCMAQRYKDEILAEFPEVDIAACIGADIVEVVRRALEGARGVVDSVCQEYGSNRVRVTPRYTAYLKIADGCDNRCTYCVIPSIRGPFKSVPMEILVEQARRFAEDGVREIIVVAQDTTMYGVDLYGEARLSLLLRELCKLDLRWIRLHYTYPERISDELIEVIAAQPKICKYLDIPFQHCDGDILKKMARAGDSVKIMDLIYKLRAAIPELALRTSLIVGFPSESDEQFERLREFVREARFERLGVFAYSQEEGTPAARMKGQVANKVKQARRDVIMKLQSDIAMEQSRGKIGTVAEVLVEGYDEENSVYWGRTYADSPEIDGTVHFKADDLIEHGEFVKVKITDAKEYDLFGEVTYEHG